MVETKEAVVACIGAGSAIFGLLCYLVAITIAFKRTVEIERRIAPPSTELQAISNSGAGGSIGRWVRILNVVMFLVFKNRPWFGPSYAELMDNGLEPIPKNLKLWVLLPIATGHFLVVVFIVMAGLLGAYD